MKRSSPSYCSCVHEFGTSQIRGDSRHRLGDGTLELEDRLHISSYPHIWKPFKALVSLVATVVHQRVLGIAWHQNIKERGSQLIQQLPGGVIEQVWVR